MTTKILFPKRIAVFLAIILSLVATLFFIFEYLAMRDRLNLIEENRQKTNATNVISYADADVGNNGYLIEGYVVTAPTFLKKDISESTSVGKLVLRSPENIDIHVSVMTDATYGDIGFQCMDKISLGTVVLLGKRYKYDILKGPVSATQFCDPDTSGKIVIILNAVNQNPDAPVTHVFMQSNLNEFTQEEIEVQFRTLVSNITKAD